MTEQPPRQLSLTEIAGQLWALAEQRFKERQMEDFQRSFDPKRNSYEGREPLGHTFYVSQEFPKSESVSVRKIADEYRVLCKELEDRAMVRLELVQEDRTIGLKYDSWSNAEDREREKEKKGKGL